jgi:lipid-binding SYLF domain-containing protein
MFLPRFALGTVVAALLTAGPAFARSTDEQQREELRAHAAATLDELFMQVSGSKEHSDNAVGYAVFAVTKAGFFVTGGGGSGVTVNKATGDTVYMKMGMGGVGLGFGGQKYDMVILFETADRLETFIDGGWDARAAANAVAGTETAGAGSGFIDGTIVYTLGEKGLMASADVSGTRFWVDEELNKRTLLPADSYAKSTQWDGRTGTESQDGSSGR